MSLNIFKASDILIPNGIDLGKWSIVACDQYTSEPEYWDRVREIVGESPSAYNITLPEIYLHEQDVETRIEKINETMKSYLDGEVFRELKDSLIYVERALAGGKVRKGLVGMVDLEHYDYHPGAGTFIRATEGTVLERIPPRVRVRENAALEIPHVMLLIDDDKKSVIEPLAEKKEGFEKAYDFKLMSDGGGIKGYIASPAEQARIFGELDKLADRDEFYKKYGINDKNKGVLLFAVGDGNHSLATAKECFERIKKELPKEKWENHPARYALVEVVNIHDASLEFEPIHRVLFDVNPGDVLEKLKTSLDATVTPDDALQSFEYVTAESRGRLFIGKPKSNLAAGSLQAFLDMYIAETGCRIDYIHGDEVVERLCRGKNSIGFLLPPLKKRELFETVVKDGVLPRKTFSMGHAHDKRFYLECRRIK